MNVLFAALGGLFAFAAAWEVAGSRGEEAGAAVGRMIGILSGDRVRSLAETAVRLRIPQRLERAGLGGRLHPAAVLGAKVAGAGVGGLLAFATLPGLAGRLVFPVALALPAAGFLAPDALLEREARRRRRRLVAALPDVLDLLAVGAAAGRSPSAVIEELSRGAGPLAGELRAVAVEIECGVSRREAVELLRKRIDGAEIGALAAALERSARYGSPLAEQLREQATTLRREERRRIEERAARAAPKIQLVVALVLVPSVLLMIAAALLASADRLLAV